MPVDKVQYDRARQVKTPGKISDPNHWGHLSWMYVDFMDSVQGLNVLGSESGKRKRIMKGKSAKR